MGMFDGIPIVGDVLNFVGGQQTNQKNWDIADAANRTNMEMQKDAQAFNAQQASLDRDFQTTQQDYSRNFNADQARISREFNASEAQKGRDYTTQMSNTAYQRAVGDLKAAGLNPMLAYMQGGSSTPSASTGSSSAASSGAAGGSHASISPNRAVLPAPMQNSLGAFQNTATKVAQIMNMNEQNELLRAQIHNTDTNSDLTRAKYFNELDLNPSVKKQVDKIMAEIGLMQQQARYSSAHTAKTYQDIAIGKPEESKSGTTWGSFSPYIKDIGNLGSAIRSLIPR